MPDDVTGARLARASDLPMLQEIEEAADTLFDGHLDRSRWTPAATGAERHAAGGFIVVAGDPVAGFAHVIQVDGDFHLEQLAVHPDHARQGLGTELVYSVADIVASRGGRSLTLLTFADTPWNQPFYEALGFEVVDPPERLKPLIEHERATGLHESGRRVAMIREITPGVEARPAVSVIPVRQGAGGLEVFMQHRVQTMDFAAGVVVFPGGRIDPVDVENAPDLPDDLVQDHVAAWRDSSFVSDSEDARLAVRVILATGVREVQEETGIRIDPQEMIPWDDWTTPPAFPKRFQVHFLVVHVPDDGARELANTTTEAHRSEWLPVDDVLEQGRRGELEIMRPTRVILQELADLGHLEAVLAAHPEVTPVHLDQPGTRPRSSRR